MKTLKQLESIAKAQQTRYDTLVASERKRNALYDLAWPVRYTRAHYFALQALSRATSAVAREKINMEFRHEA